MAEFPDDLRYAETHEWVRVEDDGTLTVGISDYAQESLGDVVFVELPEIDSEISAKAEAGVVESVKAASDIYAPVSGRIIEVNSELEDAPEIVNESPFEKGWFFKMQPDEAEDVESLLDAAQYQKMCEEEED
ncbi:MAG: glycine cleavage system protein GcvH [Pseudomonadales bacterium]|nr:glycine cleavage system protein GcvH [Pseudomonadales bacterium]